MNRQCRLDGCERKAAHHKTICPMHHKRIVQHGDPDFREWTVADETDVALIVSEARPAAGLTRLERVMVARGLTERSVPAEEIARIVGVTPRSVYRWRSEGFRQAA